MLVPWYHGMVHMYHGTPYHGDKQLHHGLLQNNAFASWCTIMYHGIIMVYCHTVVIPLPWYFFRKVSTITTSATTKSATAIIAITIFVSTITTTSTTDTITQPLPLQLTPPPPLPLPPPLQPPPSSLSCFFQIIKLTRKNRV